ncbi:unnamed protein product [Symbiodinium sp. CCMP2592]|nr:unnamed protein product [Symbiodinium sp. CCMP2592]
MPPKAKAKAELHEEESLQAMGIDTSEDAPAGHVLLVVSSKGDNKLLCLKCFYVKRGSFKRLSVREFIAILRMMPSLNDKFINLRRNHVRQTCLQPGAKPRHEAINVRLYAEQRTSSYINFQQAEGTWIEIGDYFEEKAPADIKKKCRTLAAKKNWIVNALDMKIQQDERGVEGVIILPDSKRRKVLIGTKMAADKIRRSEVETGADLEAAFQRDSSKLQAEVNTEDSRVAGPGAWGVQHVGTGDKNLSSNFKKHDSWG